MSDEKIRKWADDIIETASKFDNLCKAIPEIKPCIYFEKKIHIYSGIHEIAKALGKIAELEKSESVNYPCKYTFEYCGYTFYQISQKEKEGEDNV